ncbi:MAG: type II toxin-antitoxin system VapC family toxin [Gammaproteobacteria bacterium]|nr:type II toxin-antitoxin system VapC family toxin [Gammaproteobacteria bacterium]
MQTNNILLDTHVWVWLMTGDKTLSKSTQKIIEHAHQAGNVYIAAISTWEVSMLEQKKRMMLNTTCIEWIKTSLRSGIQLLALSPEIAVESCHLPEYSFGDPSDRLIIATARHQGLTLLTRDERIIAYGQLQYISVLAV